MLRKRPQIPKRQISLLLGDFITLLFAPVVSIYIYFLAKLGPSFKWLSLEIQPTFFLIHIATFVLTLYFFDQYNFRQDFRKMRIIMRICLAVAVGAIIMVFLSYLIRLPPQGRWIFLIYCAFVLFGVTSVRLAYSILGSVGIYDKEALIVGCGNSGKAIVELVESHSNPGVKVIGFLDNDRKKQNTTVCGHPVFLQEKGLKEAVLEYDPDLLIVAMHRSRYQHLVKELIWCAQRGIEIWDIPTAFESFAQRIPLDYVDELWLLFSSLNWPRMHVWKLKRLMDVVVAGLGLLITLPLMTITAIAIKLDSAGPILLSQKRIGKRGKIINIFKFRSMIQTEPDTGETGTSLNDCRVTRVGKVIRKLHIDEIPQFINVLKGELSMVGPRAELFDFVYEYIGEKLEDGCAQEPAQEDLKEGEPPEERAEVREDVPRKIKAIIPYIDQRFTINQGITGWAQIMYPYGCSSYEDMVKKLEYDLYYIENMSFFLDCIILLKTVKTVLLGKGK